MAGDGAAAAPTAEPSPEANSVRRTESVAPAGISTTVGKSCVMEPEKGLLKLVSSTAIAAACSVPPTVNVHPNVADASSVAKLATEPESAPVPSKSITTSIGMLSVLTMSNDSSAEIAASDEAGGAPVLPSAVIDDESALDRCSL